MAALCLLSPPTLAKETSSMTPDQSAVRTAVEAMTSAFHNKDIEGVMAAYEDQATVMFEPGQPVSDPTIIRAVFPEFFALSPTFTYAGHEVIVQGDTALHIAPWTMSATTPDGQAMSQSGLSVAVLKRQTDGSWKMIIDNPHGSHLMP